MKDTHASLHLLSECVTCRSNQLASITAQDKTEEGSTRDQTYIIFTLLPVMMSRLTASSPIVTIPLRLSHHGLFGLHLVLPCLLLLLSSSGHMHARNDRYELRALLGIWDPAINKPPRSLAS